MKIKIAILLMSFAISSRSQSIDVGTLVNTSSISDPTPTPSWGGNLVAPQPGGTVSGRNKVLLWSPSSAGDRAYNHFVSMTLFGDTIYLAYATHNEGEDYAGQYIRLQKSVDGTTWTDPDTLIPPQSQSRTGTTINGRMLQPCSWMTIDNELYFVAEVMHNNPAENQVDSVTSNTGVLAVRMSNDSIKYVYPSTGLSVYESGMPEYDYDGLLAQKVLSKLQALNSIARWDYVVQHWLDSHSLQSYSINDDYIELSGIKLTNGSKYIISRKFYNTITRLKYIRKSPGNYNPLFLSSWTVTGIPDSDGVSVWKVLSDGRVAIMGNDQVGTRSTTWRQNMFFATANQDLDFKPKNIFDVETSISTTPVYSGYQKNGGCAYMDFIEFNGKIVCGYSERKEDIYVTVFNLN